MKRILSTLLVWGLLVSGFIGTAGLTHAQATLSSFAGAYEAVLAVPTATTVPVGKIEFTVSTTGLATGKVFLPNAKSYSFKAPLALDGGTIFVNNFVIVKGRFPAGPQPLQMNLRVALDGDITGATSSSLAGVPFLLSMVRGQQIEAPVFTGKGESVAPWAGTYSFSAVAVNAEAGDPTGVSVASAVVDAKGTMTLKGMLADGTKFTATAKQSAEATYRFFLMPYKTGGNFSMEVVLTEIGETGKYQVAASEGTEGSWSKTANAKDKLFKEGFGPLSLDLSVQPWTAPLKGTTLAGALGVADKQFPLDLLADAELAKLYPGKIPSRVKLLANNKLVPVFGDELAPRTDAAWAKLWSVNVDPKTGRFTGTLKLTDFVTKPSVGTGNNQRYESAKVVTRIVRIEGVLIQQGEDADTPFVLEGYFLADPKDTEDEGLIGGVAGADVIEDLLAGAPAPNAIPSGTPGNYSVKIKTEVTIDSSDIPFGTAGFSILSQEAAPGAITNGSTQQFTIAPDLTSMTFNGRKLLLAGDGRIKSEITGGTLVYADTTKPGAKTPKKNNMIIALFLNADGTVSGMTINNIFILGARYRISIPAQTVNGFKIPAINRTVSAFTVALHAYSDLEDPVKIP